MDTWDIVSRNRYSVCVLTGTRADYGLLRPLLSRIREDRGLELRLLVTGAHMCDEFGDTRREILSDGHEPDAAIEMLLSSDTAAGMAKSTGLGMISFADYFNIKRPDILVLLGDRFEAFAAAAAAAMARIPIAHICGGDASEGAADEFMRHSITKMSALHFPSNDESAKRVIQLGESPDYVHNVGALNVECINSTKLMSLEDLEKDLKISLKDAYALVTYHPATLTDDRSPTDGLRALINAMEQFPDMRFIITKANADSGGRAINKMLDSLRDRRGKYHVFTSLGSERYLSLMRFAGAVIGNSSSGLYETPVFGVPAVNIGSRQKGRLSPENVINCGPNYDDIVVAIKKAVTEEFTRFAKQVKNPYGEGHTSMRILNYIKFYLEEGYIALDKPFYTVDFK